MSINISMGPVPIGCDNQGAIKLIISGVGKQKSKHIDVKYHHVDDKQSKGAVNFQYVTSAVNPADLHTKPLATPRHMQLLQLIDLSANESLHPTILNTEASLITQDSTNHTHLSLNVRVAKNGSDSVKEKGVRLRGEKGGCREGCVS